MSFLTYYVSHTMQSQAKFLTPSQIFLKTSLSRDLRPGPFCNRLSTYTGWPTIARQSLPPHRFAAPDRPSSCRCYQDRRIRPVCQRYTQNCIHISCSRRLHKTDDLSPSQELVDRPINPVTECICTCMSGAAQCRSAWVNCVAVNQNCSQADHGLPAVVDAGREAQSLGRRGND